MTIEIIDRSIISMVVTNLRTGVPTLPNTSQPDRYSPFSHQDATYTISRINSPNMSAVK